MGLDEDVGLGAVAQAAGQALGLGVGRRGRAELAAERCGALGHHGEGAPAGRGRGEVVGERVAGGLEDAASPGSPRCAPLVRVAGVAGGQGVQVADDLGGDDGRVTVGTPADAPAAEPVAVVRVPVGVGAPAVGTPDGGDGAEVDVAGADVGAVLGGPAATVWAVAADGAIGAGVQGVDRVHVRADDPDLDHAAGFAVA